MPGETGAGRKSSQSEATSSEKTNFRFIRLMSTDN
jgi:hypothetical protein